MDVKIYSFIFTMWILILIGGGYILVKTIEIIQSIGFDLTVITSPNQKNETIIQEMMGSVTYSLNADATSEHALRDLGIPGFNTVVVAIGTDVQASLLTTVLLKELGVPQIVGRANNHLHEEALLRLGADRVVNPERDTAVKLAHDIFHPETVEYMELSKSYGISKITPPEATLMSRRE